MVCHNGLTGLGYVASVLIAALVFDARLVPAHADSICVRCDRPQAEYECQLPTELKGFARKGARLVCLRKIAQRYGHEQCTVRRNTSGVCVGTPVDIAKLVTPGEKQKVRAGLRDQETVNPSAATAGHARRTNSNEQSAPAGAGADPRVQAPQGQPQTEPAGSKQTAENQKPDTAQGPPRTMTEVARRTAEATGEAFETTRETVEGAGKAVGGALSKSWTCLSSLFSKC